MTGTKWKEQGRWGKRLKVRKVMEGFYGHCKDFGFYSEGHGESGQNYKQKLDPFLLLFLRMPLPANRLKWALVDIVG